MLIGKKLTKNTNNEDTLFITLYKINAGITIQIFQFIRQL